MPWLNPRTRTYVLQFRVRGRQFSQQTDLRDRRKADAAQKAWKEDEKAKLLLAEKNRDAKGRSGTSGLSTLPATIGNLSARKLVTRRPAFRIS